MHELTYLASDFEKLLDKDALIPIVMFTFGGLVMLVWVVMSSIKGIIIGRAKEQTRRELAAYVAEGSLDPDKAVAMLKAGDETGDEES